MIILGIDPGPEKSGWCILDTSSRRVRDCGEQSNEEIISRMAARAQEDTWECAVETMTNYGKTVGLSTMQALVWAGRFYQCAQMRGAAACYLRPRSNVRLALCETSRAGDSQVAAALFDLFDSDGNRKRALGTKREPGPLFGMGGHRWSALAVAVVASGLHLQIRFERAAR